MHWRLQLRACCSSCMWARMQHDCSCWYTLLMQACKQRLAAAQAPALADDNGVALCDTEAGRHVGSDVAMPLLVPGRTARRQEGHIACCKHHNLKAATHRAYFLM